MREREHFKTSFNMKTNLMVKLFSLEPRTGKLIIGQTYGLYLIKYFSTSNQQDQSGILFPASNGGQKVKLSIST